MQQQQQGARAFDHPPHLADDFELGRPLPWWRAAFMPKNV